jgi:predicted dehydrogenase
LERTAEAAEEIVGICSKANFSLGVVFQHRFRAASEALQDMLSNKALGAVRIVRAEVPWRRDQRY